MAADDVNRAFAIAAFGKNGPYCDNGNDGLIDCPDWSYYSNNVMPIFNVKLRGWYLSKDDGTWPDHDSKECNYVGDGNGHWNIDFEGQPIKLVDGYCQDAPEWCK